jgi:hypothetical protein
MALEIQYDASAQRFSRSLAEDPLTEALAAAARSGEPFSQRLRSAVVLFAQEARARATPADEMLATLKREAWRALGSATPGVRAEILRHISWWAVHGYFRAD